MNHYNLRIERKNFGKGVKESHCYISEKLFWGLIERVTIELVSSMVDPFVAGTLDVFPEISKKRLEILFNCYGNCFQYVPTEKRRSELLCLSMYLALKHNSPFEWICYEIK